MTAQLFAAPFLSVTSRAENSLSLRSLRSGEQFFARRSFHFPTAPLIVRFFFLPLRFRQFFFLCVSKIFSIRRQAKFFCLPPLSYESSVGGSPRKFYARTACRFCVAEKPFFCKLYSRSPAFCTAAGLSCQNIVRSKKFCSVRHFYLHIKAAARYPRGCRFFTSFYAPLSGNNIHIHHAP